MDQLNMVLSLADQNNAWSAAQAQKQMDFQERMSNTAHQREIADLKASGLNPVLSAKLGGASTPSGASATADSSVIGAVVEILKEFSEGMMSSAASGFASGSRGRGSSADGDDSAFSSQMDNVAKGLINLLPYKYRTLAKAVYDSLDNNAPAVSSASNFLSNQWNAAKSQSAAEKIGIDAVSGAAPVVKDNWRSKVVNFLKGKR